MPLFCLSFLALLSLLTLTGHAADDATRAQVDSLFRERKWTEARTVLLQVTKAEPANAPAWNYLGLTQLALNDSAAAVAAFEQAVRLEPTSGEYQLQLGHAYGMSALQGGLLAKLSFAGKCKTAYQKAVELAPANINARWSLMEFYRQAPGFLGGGLPEAYAQANEILRLDPRRGRAALSSLYLREEKFAEAFALYDAVLQTDPTDADALYNIGRIAAQSGQQLDRGLAALRSLLSDPDRVRDVRLQVTIGQILEKQGDKPGAQTAYEAGLAADPDSVRAREALRKLKEG